MHIVLMHPNYHSGGAEIAGNWPPAWAAYLSGFLKAAGYSDITFIDCMTDHVDDDAVRDRLVTLRPDVIGVTAITPAIYRAEALLKLAKETCPDAVTVLGGIHGTFMYQQVLGEAPWIDCIVRGEGEKVLLDLVACIDGGRWPAERESVQGIAFADDHGRVIATPAATPIADLDTIQPDWGILDWSKYNYIPTGTRVAIPNMARGCPFTCSFCSQWKFWRDYRVRDPKKVVDEIEALVRDHQVGFFILADEEPTIHKKKFVQFCQELIDRGLPDKIQWGINTRVTDILRDEALLPFYRQAGLVHISLGTEAAAQLKLERFNKETTVAQNKRAIELLRNAGIVSEAQFIVGLENETPETLEETYRMARDWNPDMANWAMYTPWPFSDLFRELGDKVEVFDFEKYNFVTPIMKPDAIDRGTLLDRVMANYRRFYMNKALFQYPWTRDRRRRSYLVGCLKAFLKSGFQRTFYDLGKVGYWGPQTKKTVDFHFDESRHAPTDAARAPHNAMWKTMHRPKNKLPRANAPVVVAATQSEEAATAMACGGGTDRQLTEAEMAVLGGRTPPMACGGGTDRQLTDAEMDAFGTPRPHGGGAIRPMESMPAAPQEKPD